MPVDTTSETTEQQVSTVEENSLKQSKPDLPDIELNDDDPNEPTPSTSKNVLTDGLKRPLPDGVDDDKEKKIRLTEVSEDKLEVTNKDDNKESDIELLLQKVSESLENTIDDESNVSNKIPLPDGVDGDKEKKIRLTEVSEDKLEVTNKDDNKESDIELLLQKVSESLENTIDDESNVSNKVPLPDGVDGDKEKKIRLTEVSEDKLEVTNKDDNKESHIELLLQNVSESLENTIDDESNVSNKTHDNLKNEKNPSFNLINHNGNNGIDDKDCKEDYLDKNTLSKDISKGKKKYNPSANDVEKNLNDSSEFIENSKDIVKNGNNILTSILTKDILTSNVISCLNKSSSSDNLAITENSDPESVAVVNDTQVTENISTAVNDSTVRESNSNLSNTNIYTIENIVNSKKDDANPLLELKNKIHLTKILMKLNL
ncbi:myb-like protein D isoform X1 [Acyrthosiphon pisum]|uniref:Uncharacterized protein n=1 Tax=Acyrthosiphon pisum TaxID=7029 RepID=A0A8R2AD85_ACYPI|nr:myb-like protein D isoform X1 [Acyrthosiphon pisum]|eukprot:XP_003242339.1 PREDICTED: myb-like protein D [Acyrthosiphon pisum]